MRVCWSVFGVVSSSQFEANSQEPNIVLVSIAMGDRLVPHRLIFPLAQFFPAQLTRILIAVPSILRYAASKLVVQNISDCQYVAAMNPTAGSFQVSRFDMGPRNAPKHGSASAYRTPY